MTASHMPCALRAPWEGVKKMRGVEDGCQWQQKDNCTHTAPASTLLGGELQGWGELPGEGGVPQEHQQAPKGCRDGVQLLASGSGGARGRGRVQGRHTHQALQELHTAKEGGGGGRRQMVNTGDIRPRSTRLDCTGANQAPARLLAVQPVEGSLPGTARHQHATRSTQSHQSQEGGGRGG